MSKGKVLVIDNYKKHGTKAVQQLKSSVKEAGYTPHIVRHSEAAKLLKSGKKLTGGYTATISSGSGRSWKRTGKKDKSGKEYLDNKDAVHDHLAEADTPLYTICGSAHAVAKKLGFKIKDTGKFNRGKGEDGHIYNHKYGIEAKDLGSKVKNIETLEHAGQKFIKRAEYDNKVIAQYHPERTELGKQEITDFLDKYSQSAYHKAA